MIKAVLFDLDETLLDRTTSLISFLRDQYGRFETLLGVADFETWRDRFLVLDARGHTHKSIVYPQLLREFGDDVELAESLLTDYLECCCRYATPFPGAADTLKELRRQGLRTGLVTNGEAEFQKRHIEALGISGSLDAILISETEDLRKPDAALFHRAAERLQVFPDQCLFVGDNPEADILGAHAAGMKTAWFSPKADWPNTLPSAQGPRIGTLPQILDLITAINTR